MHVVPRREQYGTYGESSHGPEHPRDTWHLAAAVVAVLILLRVANIFRYISNNQVGIVEKLWAAKGSIKSGFIALHG
jgi:hypothetical protein